MKINYQFARIGRVERIHIEQVLLEQVEKQAWYTVARFYMLGYEYLVCVQ